MLGNLFLGTSSWEPCLGTLLGNLALEPVPGSIALEPLPGNLAWERRLGTLLWNLLGTLLGNLLLGTSSWEAGNLAQRDFGCSDLLRDLTMAEDLKPTLLGKKEH